MAKVELPVGARAVEDEVRVNFLAPLTEAATVAFREVAATEVQAGSIFYSATPADFGERSALIDLRFSSGPGVLVLSVPEAAAAVLASRVLAGQDLVIDSSLIDDCLGEIANVIAGQGKALLYGTERHYTFGTPRVASGVGRAPLFNTPSEWLVLSFQSDLGDVFLQASEFTSPN